MLKERYPEELANNVYEAFIQALAEPQRRKRFIQPDGSPLHDQRRNPDPGSL